MFEVSGNLVYGRRKGKGKRRIRWVGGNQAVCTPSFLTRSPFLSSSHGGGGGGGGGEGGEDIEYVHLKNFSIDPFTESYR